MGSIEKKQKTIRKPHSVMSSPTYVSYGEQVMPRLTTYGLLPEHVGEP